MKVNELLLFLERLQRDWHVEVGALEDGTSDDALYVREFPYMDDTEATYNLDNDDWEIVVTAGSLQAVKTGNEHDSFFEALEKLNELIDI